MTIKRINNKEYAVGQKGYACKREKNSDNHGGESFIFAMTIVMPRIGGLCGYSDEYEHDNIGDEVGKRMDGIGHHSRTTAKNTGQKFEHNK